MGLSSTATGQCLMSIFLLLFFSKSHAQNQVFDIMQFGGKPDGVTDNSKALTMAWMEGCEYNGPAVVLIPQGTFLVLPVTLQGPCNGSIQLQIDGKVLAPAGEPSANGDHWLALRQVNNLVVDGQGFLDGQGSSAWPFTRCSTTLALCNDLIRPITLKLSGIENGKIRNIKSINSKLFHFSAHGCQNMVFDNVTIIAPENSPNTDGIHISESISINITNSFIGTGDDCISLGPGSKDINITNVQCGPGHGISIGSLGQYSNELDVAGITVRDSIFNRSKNGVRIKSWSTSFPSRVTKISFINLQMKDVEHPIIIDQNYCPRGYCHYPHQKSRSRVQIEDVRYEDIRGTSTSKVGVQLECSEISPCQGIVLKDINMTFYDGGLLTSTCYNVRGSAFGIQLPPSCLSN